MRDNENTAAGTSFPGSPMRGGAPIGCDTQPAETLGKTVYPGPYRVSLVERIQKTQHASFENIEKNNRALSILHAHPEFEDLLWLWENYRLYI